MKSYLNPIFSILLVSLVFSCQSKYSDFGIEEDQAYRNYLETLASDEFLGRKPFTEGEKITLKYLEEQFKELGLEPGNGNSYFQDVPMVDILGKFEGEKAVLTGKNGKLVMDQLSDFVGGTRRVVEKQEIKDAPLIFLGFGIDAPEYDWNDFEGVDVEGKVIVVLVNDPGYYSADLFRGRDVTYYGRWTYKFEEAARKGAKGVLIIHDTGPASYGWSVVRSGWAKSKLFLQTEDDNMSFCALEGWLTEESAAEMFRIAGVENPEELIESAKKPGFKAVPLDVSFTGTIHNEIKKSVSKNVVALLPGTGQKDEYIIYTGHWDHFGIGESINGDSIYNGAADNATGTAGLLTLAKKFKETGENKRSVVFLSVTAEEAGLLGSEYYATHPIYPLKNTVANINMDVLQPFGRMKDVFIIGKGQSTMDDYLEKAARRQGRIVREVEDPSNGWYYRSDHFNFAKVGIPTLYLEGGSQSVEHGEEWGAAQKAAYVKDRYHKPSDEYTKDWDTAGSMEDLQMIYEVGKALSNSNDFPTWHEGTLYKRIRDAQR